MLIILFNTLCFLLRLQGGSRSRTPATDDSGTAGDEDCSQQSIDNEETALLGAMADDREADFIRHVLNEEVLAEPDHLLSRLLPLVVHLCAHPHKYPDADLQVRSLCPL